MTAHPRRQPFALAFRHYTRKLPPCFVDILSMIEIEINTDTLQNSLNAVARRTAHTKPLMTRLARIMRNAVLDNFAAAQISGRT